MNGNHSTTTHELHFRCLRDGRRAMVFPCDGRGYVDMDGLSHRALNDYLFARAFIGRDFSRPSIRPAACRARVEVA